MHGRRLVPSPLERMLAWNDWGCVKDVGKLVEVSPLEWQS